MNLDPPFDVDDHSHVPIIFAEDVDSLPARAGVHEWRGTIFDGNGWELSTEFTILE